ncbi:MAG: TonB family protein [Candidatus Competibacteraceae bacterium]
MPAAQPKPARVTERLAPPPSHRSATGSLTLGRLSSTALLNQVARLETESQRQQSAGIRTKRVSLTDTRSVAGFYAADWVRKVTRVGEMNFPDAARRLNLSAGPLLEVAIRADGSLMEVRILRSSGNTELDRAAQRIVKLAAPYPPFPAELRQQADLLRIESPWRFDPGGRVRARSYQSRCIGSSLKCRAATRTKRSKGVSNGGMPSPQNSQQNTGW